MKKKVSAIPMIFALLCFISVNVSAQKKPQAAAPQLGKATLKDVIKAMTLEEKSKLVVGMGFKMPGMPKPTSQSK